MSIQTSIKALISDPEFLSLAKQFQVTNIFHVAGMGSQEIKHSNVLAWLLNPTETHGLEDAVIKSILSRLYDESIDAQFPLQDSIIGLLFDDLHDSTVVRESESNIDLLYRTRDKRLVVCIENKVGASIGDQQLRKYYRYVEQNYGDYQNKVYIFLSPSGYEVPADKFEDASVWLPFSYASLSLCLQEVLSASNNAKTTMLIEDYLDLLERRGIVENPELQQTIDKLYSRYSDVFDLIITRKSDSRKVVEGALKKLYVAVIEELAREGKIVAWDSTYYKNVGQYIGFSTQRMNEYLPYEEGVFGTWNDGGSYCYWIYPDNPDRSVFTPTIKLELGPRNHSELHLERMERIRAFARPGSKPIQKSDRYRRVKSLPTGIDERDTMTLDEIDEGNIRNLLKQAILNMLDSENEFFASISDEYQDDEDNGALPGE